ncbi:diacylglycerol kinase family lipid kinase [bacterium]|nr:diacylglycerol kinase family lipid kinase [bacterium]MBU1065185.1 diacylglycerol kinase family lipid kinase [bacterium]MBU1635169.1 diacylglycerol kinase family lipid kinase [bacterium]MBU1872694.1 diacylglycerol kinase family lipid kinase [bacterium]
MKVLLVYNPFAGHQRAQKILPEVEAYFQEKGIKFDLRTTDYHEHGIQIVAETDLSQYDGVVAAGGDGTLFEVINGYFRNESKKKIPLGVLPVGTGNAFARDLDLHNTHWKDAIDIIALQSPRKVDVGKFTTHGESYYFLNILGLGFVADVTEFAHKLKFLGNLSYTLGVLQKTIFLNSYPLTITIDGQEYQRENIFVEISNTRWTSNFLMAPSAEIDDGYLDVTLLGKLGRIKLLQSFPKIFTGEHIHIDEIETFKAKEITVETGIPKVLTPDGELLGITPIEVKCLHKAVEVFWR